ncbi:MAG: hypothetical protein IVW57_18470, partial [Ktedonobacterales bacterium]|nr:hypothetical protein [Ktedonobacterales bacterium]
PTLAPNTAAQFHNQNGVQMTLSLTRAHTGANPARITVTDAQGKAIPQAHVTVIANQSFVNAGGIDVAATPDPDGQPTDFAASLTFAQPGAWQVVVFVATADQSVSASTIFTVNVPA